jgi:hypothetical protein
MSYEEFVRIFEEGQAESFRQGVETDVEYPQMLTSRLSNAELERRLRQKIEEQADVLLNVKQIYCVNRIVLKVVCRTWNENVATYRMHDWITFASNTYWRP